MHDKDVIDKDCIEEAIDKKIFHGNRSKKEQHIEDKNIVAYHEAGHAVMSAILLYGFIFLKFIVNKKYCMIKNRFLKITLRELTLA